MDPQAMMGGQNQGTNLLNILVDIAFGFVAGLIVFLGFNEVITYGEQLATSLLEKTGYGAQMGAFGFATAAAPYIILAPIAGFTLRHLASIRSIKGFLFFAGAIGVGFAIAFFTQEYFKGIIS